MRAALLLLLLASGCGFERATPFAGARIPDVGPWSDAGPLTLCDGAAHIVAPSLGAAGLCTPASSAAPTSCTSDSDCADRERCLCGSCSVAVCDSADECGRPNGPFVCTFADRRCDHACDADADCATGERCLPGRHVCRGACATTSDCQHGERCDTASGLCVTAACAGDADCGGLACAVQRTTALVAHPSPVATSGGVTLYFEHTDANGVTTIRRASGDGTTLFVDATLFPGSTPSVARLANGSFAMIFAQTTAAGTDLFATGSPDGFAWSAPTPALSGASQPSLVFAVDGTPLLWALDPAGNLTRFSGTPELVFTTPLVALTPVSARTPLWPDVDTLATPFAERYVDADGSPRLRLWFAAHGTGTGPSSQFGTPTPTPADYSIGLAVSSDGATFIPDAYDPVFDRATDFINHPGELDPAVIAVDNRWLLYYRRAKADGSAAETLAVAASPVIPR
jgi:hypothetical protein